MFLLNAKFTADWIFESHVTQRSCPLPILRLSSRGDFLVRLRLANLRLDWQRFKSTWADLELRYIYSVTWNRRKCGCSCLGPSLKLLTWPWSFRPNSPWICTQGIPKTSPPSQIPSWMHTAFMSFMVHAAFPTGSKIKCPFFGRVTFPINSSVPNKPQIFAHLVWAFCLP